MVVHGSPNPWCRVTEIARQSPAGWVQWVRFPPARALPVDENQRKRLRFLATSGKPPQRVALRARLPLLASEGVPNHAIVTRGVIGILRRLFRKLQAAFPHAMLRGRLDGAFASPAVLTFLGQRALA